MLVLAIAGVVLTALTILLMIPGFLVDLRELRHPPLRDATTVTVIVVVSETREAIADPSCHCEWARKEDVFPLVAP